MASNGVNNKLVVSTVAAAIIFGAGGYYLGMRAGTSQASARGTGQFSGRAGRGGTGAAFGTIVAKDATSITVQLMTGTSTAGGSGSKIVLYDNSTQIGKMVAGRGSDLTVGTSVVVSGTANSDGSITAQSIQIRPAGAGPRASGQ